MLRSVFTKTLWDQRRVLFGWAIGITAVGVGYAAFYPAINSPQYLDMLESFRRASSMPWASPTSRPPQAISGRRRSDCSVQR
jgi:hypothetical protein